MNIGIGDKCMFRSFIYLDEQKMYSYLRQINKEFASRTIEKIQKKPMVEVLNFRQLALHQVRKLKRKENIEQMYLATMMFLRKI